MTYWPHTRLLLGPLWTVVVSGPHIQVIDPINGKIVHSTARLVGEEMEALLKSGPIRCLAVDGSFAHLATVGDDKMLKIWQIVGLRVMSVRPLPKKPTEVAFTRDGFTILVSDKFGDVFSYPLYPKTKPEGEAEPSASSSKRSALTSHENPSDGELVLGHVSLLTSFLLTRDEKHIITADRDEHIRVSWYPKGYVIERYCLGHEKFVSEIHIPAFAPEVLISGGGDPVLKMWDWMSGEVIAEVPILEVVEPYIKVKAPKGRRSWDDGDHEEGGVGENNTARRRRRGRKGQGKGKDVEEGVKEGMPVLGDREGSAVSGEGAQGAHEDDVEMAVPEEEEAERTVLVIHKIRSCDQGRHGKFVLFSAVGATALFYFTYPESGEGPPPEVHAVDLGYPVLDFMMGVYQTTWILLDVASAQAEAGTNRPANKPSPAVLLSWASGSQPVVVGEDDVPTLTTLRTSARLPATPDELKTLDLYATLSSLPKNVDPEHDPLRRDVFSEATPELGAEDKDQKELSQREQARLKKKRALAAKLAEEKMKGMSGESKGEGGERERKRVKSDGEADASPVDAVSSGELMDGA